MPKPRKPENEPDSSMTICEKCGVSYDSRYHHYCTVCAPFSEDQVNSLNEFQVNSSMHPFTCGHNGCAAILEATPEGWHCPNDRYTQNWAHTFMTDWSWKEWL